MSNMTIIASGSSPKESRMDTYPMPRYSAISEHSSVKGSPQAIRDWLIACQADFPASPSLSPENVRGKWTNETCGRTPFVSLKLSGQNGAYWKTCQGSLLEAMGILAKYSETWPKRGTMLNGECWALPTLERPTGGNGSGLWPTPKAVMPDNLKSQPTISRRNRIIRKTGHDFGINLQDAVRLWPTPKAQDAKHGAATEWELQNNRENHHLHVAVAKLMFPTPRAIYGEHPGMNDPSHLTGAVKTFPTPTNSMMTTADMEQARYAGNGGKRPDYQEAKKTWPTPTQSDGMGGPGCSGREGGSNLRTAVDGQLNPDWTEWLMGWPISWTSLEPLEFLRCLSWDIDPATEWEWWPSRSGAEYCRVGDKDYIPRVATGVKDRTNRLKALGNGQVPQCMAAAWQLMTGGDLSS